MRRTERSKFAVATFLYVPSHIYVRAYSRPFFLRKARMRIIVFTTWRPFLPVWCREDGCEFRELPLVMPPSKVCPQCNAVVPKTLKVCRNRLKFALYNTDRVNFKSTIMCSHII